MESVAAGVFAGPAALWPSFMLLWDGGKSTQRNDQMGGHRPGLQPPYTGVSPEGGMA